MEPIIDAKIYQHVITSEEFIWNDLLDTPAVNGPGKAFSK